MFLILPRNKVVSFMLFTSLIVRVLDTFLASSNYYDAGKECSEYMRLNASYYIFDWGVVINVCKVCGSVQHKQQIPTVNMPLYSRKTFVIMRIIHL